MPIPNNNHCQEPQPTLQNLIPVAVAIACGCEPCAEATVKQALEKGSSKRDLEHTLRIIAYMRNLNCLNQAVGPEVIARMEKPLSAAAKALQRF